MHIAALILINILIVNVWLRLSKTIFASPLRTNNTSSTSSPRTARQPFLLGILGGGLLLPYPKLLQTLDLPQLLYTLTNPVSRTQIVTLTISILIFLTLISLIRKHRPQITTLLTTSLTPLVLIAILITLTTLLDPLIGSATYILYFLIVAFSEESVKFFSATSSARSMNFLPSDIILLSIIAALGFGFIENIIYALSALSSTQSTISALKPAINSTLTRGAIGFLMHSLFTGTAATIIAKHYTKSPKTILLRTTLGVLSGIIFHTFYNTVVHQGRTRLIITIVSLGYLLLTYLMVSSDSVYLDDLEG